MVEKSGKKWKTIKVNEGLWATIKARAKKEGRTIEGELQKKYETP